MLRLYKFLRKEWVATLFLLLSACSSSSAPQWQFDRVITDYPCFNSGQLLFPIQDTYRNLELEFLRSASGERLYVNAYSLPFPGNPNDHTKTDLQVVINGQASQVTTERLEGGQRLLLPADATARIIDALQQDQPVEISFGRYRVEVVSTKFAEGYQKLQAIPLQ